MKKVVVIGPESTGKSTLCQQLAAHYKTLWCPEYAREYLEEHGTAYTYDDLLKIAKGQLALEDDYTRRLLNLTGSNHSSANRHPSTDSNHQLLFVDTDMYVMKVWCEFVFGKTHPFITGQINQRRYDLYLLCNIDLPWVKDDLREYPDIATRQQLFSIYQQLLASQNVPWKIIEGNYNDRLQSAVNAVDKLLQAPTF